MGGLGAVSTVVGLVLLASAPLSAAGGKAHDRAIATSGLLTLSDLPTGWTQEPRPKDSSLDQQARSISQCRRLADFDAKTKKSSVDVPSPDFNQGQQSVNNSVHVFSRDADAMQAMRIASDANLATCLQKVAEVAVRRSLAKNSASAQVRTLAVDVRQLSVTPVGDQTVGYRLTVSVGTTIGVNVTAYLDAQFVLVGRVVATYGFQSNTGSGVAFAPALIDASQRRLRAALTG